MRGRRRTAVTTKEASVALQCWIDDLAVFGDLAVAQLHNRSLALNSPSHQVNKIRPDPLHVHDIESQNEKAEIPWRWWARRDGICLCYNLKASGRRPALLDHAADAWISIFINERLQNASGPIHVNYGMNISSGDCRISIGIDTLPQKIRAASNYDNRIILMKRMFDNVANKR